MISQQFYALFFSICHHVLSYQGPPLRRVEAWSEDDQHVLHHFSAPLPATAGQTLASTGTTTASSSNGSTRNGTATGMTKGSTSSTTGREMNTHNNGPSPSHVSGPAQRAGGGVTGLGSESTHKSTGQALAPLQQPLSSNNNNNGSSSSSSSGT